MQIKKSIFLKNYKNDCSSGVLSLERDLNILKGTLNLYNFNRPFLNLALGINSSGKILKYPVSSDITEFKIPLDNKNFLETEISCALIDLSDVVNPQILLGATSFKVETLINNLDLDKRAKLYEYTDEEIDNLIYSETSKIASISTTKNDKSSYQKTEILNEAARNFDDEYFEDEIDLVFYNKVKKQLDEIFSKNQSEPVLEEILQDSKWVKIDYDNEKGYYALGLIYNNFKPKYICYALPKDSPRPVPPDIKDYAQWLPLDTQKPNESGYWIVYQDAKDGTSLIVDII